MPRGADTGDEIRLRDGPSIELDAAGFLHPRAPRSKRTAFTRYGDVTHVALSERGIWIATKDDLVIVPRDRFEVAADTEYLGKEILRRIGARPDGPEILARMREIEQLGQREPAPVAVWSLVVLCIVAFVAEYFVQPEVVLAGQFSPRLTMAGDLWRVVTGNLLHGFPLHLGLNLVGLIALGRIVERTLGTARTVCVMGGAALAAMGVTGIIDENEVMGVSGVVLGLGGSLLWLELRHRREQPAWWRFPRGLRRLLFVALLTDLALGFVVPMIAGAAHLGGALGGVASTALVLRGGGLLRPAGGVVRGLARGVVAVTAVSVVWAAAELVPGDYVARHAQRLAELPGVAPTELNNVAWFIALDPDATQRDLEAALRVAEQAVSMTDAQVPNLLDTLAEVYFHMGRSADAIATIDQAIALAPEESYYREQRRRYTGERPPYDRPPAPDLAPPSPRVLPLPLDHDLKGEVSV